jgi:CRP/FNR family transcriptional regulator
VIDDDNLSEGLLRDRCGVSEIAAFSTLPPEHLKQLEGACRLRRYQAGQTVVASGERAEFIGCVTEGFLRMQKVLQDGRHHIVGLLVEGDMFGRVFDGPLNIAIEAATDAEVLAFRRGPFEKLLLSSPELERMVLRNLISELDRARDWMLILSNPRTKGRLAGFLLVLCTRFPGIDHVLRSGEGSLLDVKIPINRTDLAHLLGTRPESVSRAFHSLADDGVIAIRKPDLVGILDIEALAAEAGDEYEFSPSAIETIVEALRKSDTPPR